jgi:hypothetical protein
MCGRSDEVIRKHEIPHKYRAACAGVDAAWTAMEEKERRTKGAKYTSKTRDLTGYLASESE